MTNINSTIGVKIGKAKEKYNKRIESILPKRCVLNAGECSLNSDEFRRSELIKKQPYSFIMRPYKNDCLDMEKACKETIEINCYIAHNVLPYGKDSSSTRSEIASIQAKDESFIGHGYCQICSLCQYSYFGVAELAHLNPNVLLEIGLMFAFAKPVIFTLDTRLTSIDEVPFDIFGVLLISYQNNEELKRGLKSKIFAVLEELKSQNLL